MKYICVKVCQVLVGTVHGLKIVMLLAVCILCIAWILVTQAVDKIMELGSEAIKKVVECSRTQEQKP